jgi:hypothetical protein
MRPILLALSAAAAAACSPPAGRERALDPSSPPGRLDAPSPPWSAQAAGLEALLAGRYDESRSPSDVAREKLAEVAATIVASSSAMSFLSGAEYFEFYTRPRSAGNPGLCETDVVAIVSPSTERSGLDSYRRYAVAGSLAPLPGLWNQAYGRRLEAVCASRRDMRKWFRADDANAASRMARMVDAAVHAARGRVPLPFQVACRTYDRPEAAPRCRDPRALLASLDPRAIGEAEPACPERPLSRRPGSLCATVHIAKQPDYWDQKDKDSWELTLVGRFSASGDDPDARLALDSVEVGDSYLIVE